MSNYINYAIPTSSDYWTHEDDDVPAAFFDRIARELSAFVAQTWPGTNFSTRLVVETVSGRNRTRAEFDNDDEEFVIDTIDNWMSSRWPDWLAETYEGKN